MQLFFRAKSPSYHRLPALSPYQPDGHFITVLFSSVLLQSTYSLILNVSTLFTACLFNIIIISNNVIFFLQTFLRNYHSRWCSLKFRVVGGKKWNKRVGGANVEC